MTRRLTSTSMELTTAVQVALEANPDLTFAALINKIADHSDDVSDEEMLDLLYESAKPKKTS